MKKFILFDNDLNKISETSFDNLVPSDFNFKKVQDVHDSFNKEVLEAFDHGIQIFLPYGGGKDFLIQYIGKELATFGIIEDYFKFEGCLLSEAFPYSEEAKITEMFKEVYKTGIPITFICKGYENENLFYGSECKIIKSENKIYLLSKSISNLLIAEEREKYLLNQSSQGIINITSDFKIIYMNDKLKDLTGYSIDELNSLNLNEAIPYFYNSDKNSYSWKEILSLIFNNELFDYYSRFEFICKSGKSIYFTTHSTKINLKDEFLQIYLVDITREVEYENELKRITDNLRLAQKDNNFTFAHYSEGKWYWDEGIYDILEINPEDYDVHEDLIANFADSKYNFDFYNKINNLSADNSYSGSDTKIITPKGNKKILHRDFNIKLDENGEIIYISELIRDVSNQIFTKNQLDTLKENLDIVQEVSNTGLFFREGDKYTWTKGIYNILEREPREGDEFRKIIAERVISENKKYAQVLSDIKQDDYGKMPDIFKGTGSIQLENGKIKHILLFVKKNSENHVLSGLVQDISEEVTYKNELDLKSSEALRLKENLEVIQGITKLAIGVWNEQDDIFSWTSEIYNILEIDVNTNYDYDIIDEFVIDSDKAFFAERKKINEENPIWSGIIKVMTPKANLKYLYIYSIREFRGGINSRIGFVQDITELKNKELKALELQDNLIEVQKISNSCISYFSDGVLTYTPQVFDIVESSPDVDECGSLGIKYAFKEDLAILNEALANLTKESPECAVDYRIRTKSGKVKYIQSKIRAEFKGDELINRVGVHRDITLEREYEHKLKLALDEKNVLIKDKEFLLKEVHHRVKNNLQIILSLISLDKRFKFNEPDLIISSVQNRINTIALIHEKIYGSDTLADVRLDDYIISLVKSLLDLYFSDIKFSYDLDEIELDMDLAIPVGLIINELVNNIIKYAFPNEGDEGNVFISLKSKEGVIELIVEDDGIGLGDIDIYSSPSLGLTVVNNLIAQVEGSIIKLDKPGTAFKIEFKK